MTKDEALQMAHRALSNKNASTKRIYEALAAIQTALAQTSTQCEKQPAQEPVHNVTSNGRYSPLLTHMMNTRTAPQPQEPRNFCPRCGKRTADLTVIHTCTPPRGLEMT